MIDNEIVSKIGQKIRAIRRKKNLTIKQLAERTKVTKGLLSKIENSRTIPSLPVFVHILQSLDISLKDFFEDMAMDNEQNYLLVRKNEYKAAGKDGKSRLNYRQIVEKIIPASKIEIFLLTIKPGSDGNPRVTDGFKFKHLISGACEFHFKNEIVTMGEGDSIYFNASIPHVPANKTDKDALILAINFRF